MPLKALFLVSIISNTEINIIFKCTNLKVVYRITLIVSVIGKTQFRRAMLSCDSSCYSLGSKSSLGHSEFVDFVYTVPVYPLL